MVTCLVVINVITFALLAISTYKMLTSDMMFNVVSAAQLLGLFGELPRIMNGILSTERFHLKSGLQSSWNEAPYHMSLERDLRILNIFCASSVPTRRAGHSYLHGCSKGRLGHDA